MQKQNPNQIYFNWLGSQKNSGYLSISPNGDFFVSCAKLIRERADNIKWHKKWKKGGEKRSDQFGTAVCT